MSSSPSRSPSGRLLLALHTFGQSFMHVPALLSRTGFPVDAVITRRHSLRGIRGISKRYLTEPSEWASVVEKRLLTGEYAFFLNVDEPGLVSLYRHAWHRDVIRFLPFPPDSAVAAMIGSKKALYEWCLATGIPTPETHVCKDIHEANTLRAQLPGKWFLKGDAGSGGELVKRCLPGPIPEEMAGEPSGSWLLQRDEGNEVGSGIFLANHGRLVCWMGVRKIVCLNGGLGPTVLGHGEYGEDIGVLCMRVAAASGVTGLTGFDFVRSPDRGPLLIDSHLGRMSPMQHFDHLYGVDFAKSLRTTLEGLEIPCTSRPAKGPAFVKYPEVLQLALEGGLSKLFRALDPGTRMPLAPRGDPVVGIRSGVATIFSQTRVNLGRWRQRVLS